MARTASSHVVSYVLTEACNAGQVAAGLGHCLGVTHKGDVMAWGWAAAGQLGLGHCHQGSHTVLHPTPVSFSLYSSSSSPRLQGISCILFQELGLHIRPLSQAIVLASGHRLQMPQ